MHDSLLQWTGTGSACDSVEWLWLVECFSSVTYERSMLYDPTTDAPDMMTLDEACWVVDVHLQGFYPKEWWKMVDGIVSSKARLHASRVTFSSAIDPSMVDAIIPSASNCILPSAPMESVSSAKALCIQRSQLPGKNFRVERPQCGLDLIQLVLRHFRRTSFEHFTLHSPTPDGFGTTKLIFRQAALIHMNDGSDIRVFRGQLVCSSTGFQRDAVCKLAYGQHYMTRVATEARLYSGKLKHLQGVYVLQYHGHFVGRTDEGPVSCIALDYCGQELDLLFLALPVEFKRALICTMSAIHDAGIRHFDIRNQNVLNNNGLPVVIDFGEAEDHVCERTMEIVENVAAPMDYHFGYDELHQLCIDLRIWKPGMFKYITSYRPAQYLYRPYTLAEMAPDDWSYEDAVNEAYRAIGEHIEEFYPEDYAQWCSIVDEIPPPSQVHLRASDSTPALGSDGLASVINVERSMTEYGVGTPALYNFFIETGSCRSKQIQTPEHFTLYNTAITDAATPQKFLLRDAELIHDIPDYVPRYHGHHMG
ncbi:hypothetical protein EVG20_g1790 [Dentipellis fragilis]|uniref:Protein kinase domain-containing protein n=1 Tax=Dentipellis fragilis TaxID=205917 RepID=A0A4Y9Z8L3_9AGAM|nr:hypothetical protein EVG20_g1790 [Dentipellis fragilis]